MVQEAHDPQGLKLIAVLALCHAALSAALPPPGLFWLELDHLPRLLLFIILLRG